MALKKRLNADNIALRIPVSTGEDILKEIARRAVNNPPWRAAPKRRSWNA